MCAESVTTIKRINGRNQKLGRQVHGWVKLAPVNCCSHQGCERASRPLPANGVCLSPSDDSKLGRRRSLWHPLLSPVSLQTSIQHSSPALLHGCTHNHPHVEEDPVTLNMPDELAPPRKSVELEDPGAKELGVFFCLSQN